MSPLHSGAAAFVLAGGQSTRMHTDKALVHFEGRPLIAHALQILRDAALEPAIAGARSDLSGFAPVIADTEPDLGPLSGICAALASTSTEWSLFLSVDLPLLPASLMVYLLFHAQLTGAAATVVSINGVAQTFPSVIHHDVLPVLVSELRAGRRGCFAGYGAAASALDRALNVLPAEMLAQAGQVTHSQHFPPARWFLNLNTPVDLESANARVHRHRVS